MKHKMKNVLKGIAELRNILEKNIENKGISDPEVAIISRELDKMLVHYYKLISEK